MALTATAQSAFREPAWDEVIVPTLRKRPYSPLYVPASLLTSPAGLQNESNVLARRISAASVGSTEDHADMYQSAASLSREDTTTPPARQYPHPKANAVPRANGQQVRADIGPGRTQQSPPSRARSLSQPYILDPPNKTDKVAGSSASPPMPNGRTVTRIPMSRGRTSIGSNSSHAQNSVNGGVGGRTEEGSELRSVDEGHETYPMRSTVRIPRHKASDLFDEAPPFSSSTSSHFQLEDDTRVSSESEERPFEHWYRGDVSRNGGVGELRVGRRAEMLDIANYGYTLRNASSHIVNNGYQRSRSNSRSRDAASSRYGMRQRAESVSAAVRQDAVLDEDEAAMHDAVMDEQAPADFDSDGYEDPADLYGHYPDGTASSPSLALYPSQNGSSVTARHRPGHSQSRIPTPSRQASTEPHTPTTTSIARGAPAPTTPTSIHHTPRARQGFPRSQTQPLQPTQRQKTPTPSVTSSTTAKRRAASPAASTSLSGAKRPKASSKPPSSMPKRTNKEENRRSIGQYPTPDGDDVMDAIPSWTQPIPPTGNWDDVRTYSLIFEPQYLIVGQVILPVVARKKGLEGHYETADGSPKPPQRRGSEIFEPVSHSVRFRC